MKKHFRRHSWAAAGAAFFFLLSIAPGKAGGEELSPAELRALLETARPMPTPSGRSYPEHESRSAVQRQLVGFDLAIRSETSWPAADEPAAGAVLRQPGAPAALLRPAEAADGQEQDSVLLGAATQPTPVVNTLVVPYTSVVKLLMRFPVGAANFYYVCSAATAGSFHLLTAGHCLYNHDPNDDGSSADAGWAAEVWAWPAQTDQVDAALHAADWPYGFAKASFLRSYNGWTTSQNLDHDWGWITLDQRLGDHTGWLGKEANVTASSLNFDGYPIETPYVPAGTLFQYLGFDNNNTLGYTAFRILMNAFVFGGHSGGPVWRRTGDQRFIQGVNSTSDREGSAEATLLTAARLNEFAGIVSTDESARPPVAWPDLIEYLFDLDAKDISVNSVTAGNPVQVEYSMLNGGFASSGNVTLDFYLSPDSNITSGDSFLSSLPIGSLAAFSFANASTSVTIPASQAAGVYYLGWIARGTTAEYSTANNAVVVGDETLTVQGAAGTPDIRIEPLGLSFTQANPRPIYVELDWMQTSSHSHRPSQAVIDRIVDAFAAAGYTLHLEVSEAIPHQDLLPVVAPGPSASPAIQAIAAQYFDRAGDSRYHYSLWVHNHSYQGVSNGSSGNADLPGRMHLVSLGTFSNQVGTFSNQVGTFVHEFGHNLGQTHGGVDHAHWKPNYLSVMNYFYQLDGIGPALLGLGFANSSAGIQDFGFSHGLLPALNENALDERTGIGLGRAVDWDCDGIIETSVAKDLQASNWCQANGARTSITDFDNWSSVASNILSLAPGGSAEPCISATEYDLLRQAVQDRAEAAADHGTFAASIALPQPVLGPGSGSFTIFNDGTAALNVSSIQLDTATPWIAWSPPAPFTVAAGRSQRVFVSVDWDLAPVGTTSRRMLVGSNDPNENPYPGGVNLTIVGDGDCSLATSASPTIGGTTSGGVTTACGTQVTAKAFPAAGFSFTRWREGSATVSASAVYSFTLAGARNLVAEFATTERIFADGFESGTTGAWIP